MNESFSTDFPPAFEIKLSIANFRGNRFANAREQSVSAWREKNAFSYLRNSRVQPVKAERAKSKSECNASTFLEQANSRVFQRFPAGFARERRRGKREGFLMKYFSTVS